MGQYDPSAFLGITVQGINGKKSFRFQNLYGVNMPNINKSQEI